MIRFGVLASLAVAVALGVFILAHELRQTRADLAAAEARLQGFEEAARVHARHVAALEAERAEAVALDLELQRGEGANAPLSDYLGGWAGRVWP
jgi:hypothetical protein